MLEKTFISNYKSVKDLELSLSKINILVGPNNSGKTSILEGISLMRELFTSNYNCCEENLQLPVVRLNKVSYNKLVHGFKEDQLIKLGFIWRKDKDKYKKIIGISPKKATLEVCFNSRCLVAECVQDERVITRYHLTVNSVAAEEKSFNDYLWSKDISVFRVNEEISMANKTITGLAQKIFFITAERGTHQLYHPVPDNLPSPKDARIQDAFDILYFIRYKTSFTRTNKIINEFLKPYNFEDIRTLPVPGKKYEVVVKDTLLNNDINVAQIGFGLNQLIPILILLSYYPDESLILIEQPELHMHPRLQSEFAKLIEYASKTKRHQLVIETHSEHILFNLLNLVAKKRISKDDLRIYYVHKDGSETKVDALKITEHGTIEGGVPGFFETEFDTFLDWVQSISER